ncbi:MAG: hypothetical protein D9V47_03390 [Clostridia bacterium]|nr:MAG: hypothetical protein D9V47_03390 [Clostridia bacterium]
MEAQLETPTQAKPRKRYSKDFKLRVLEEVQEKHLTVEQVCQKYGLHKSVYYRWLARYRQKGEEGRGAARKAVDRFDHPGPNGWPPSVQGSAGADAYGQ